MSVRYRSASVAPRRRIATDLRLFLLVLSIAIPTALLLVWMATDSNLPVSAQATIAVTVLAWILIAATTVRGELLRDVRTLSNLVESIRSNDYSVKGARLLGVNSSASSIA